ncbi:MAG: type II toxin-antitoxin system RelE/ParE family toxin [Bryobacteraceae bacterium]
MEYRAELAARAERDLAAIYQEVNAVGSKAAARWFNGLERAVYTLERLPMRCPSAPENKLAGRPLRHLLYVGKPEIYRVIYAVDESRRVVRILAIRNGAREIAGG